MLTLFLRNSIFTVSLVYSGSQSELLLPAEGPSAAGWLGTCSLGNLETGSQPLAVSPPPPVS